MSLGRRVPVLAVLAVGAVVIGGVSVRSTPAPVVAQFAALSDPTTPFVPLMERLTSSFFCAGVPAASESSGGEVVVANPTNATLVGQVSTFTTAGAAVELPLLVAPRSSSRIDLGVLADEGFVGSLVEIAGSGAVVEQVAVLEGRSSVAPCSNSASTQWTLASGSTLDAENYDLVLTNPFPDAAVVDLTFITATDTRTPNEFQNFVIPGRSVRVIDVDQVARDEPQLALSIGSRRGRLVAARAQQFADGGSSVALAASSGARQWLFADGELGEGISESVSIVNTGDTTASVDLTFFAAVPSSTIVPPFSTQIAPGRSVTVEPGALGLELEGRYGLSVAGAGEAALVVERVTRRADGVSTVVLGSRFGSGRWWIASGVPEAADAALIVFNATGLAGEVSVSALGPGGTDALPGLEAVLLPAAGTITIDLPDGAVGVPLLVESSTLSLVVEQRRPDGDGGRSGALGLPE